MGRGRRRGTHYVTFEFSSFLAGAVPPAVFSTGGTIEPGDTDRNQPHRSTESCAHSYPMR